MVQRAGVGETRFPLVYNHYFTENFQAEENKTKSGNIHLRFFHLLF